MADDVDDGTWVLDLEAALLEDNLSASVIHGICRGRTFPDSLRAEAWQSCLGVRNTSSPLLQFSEIYDLPDQAELREACQTAVEKLGNEEADKVAVVCDIESVLTCYCKRQDVSFHKSWVDVLLCVLALKKPRDETYDLFEAVLERYVPNRSSDVYHLLRLLILYHDPQLCSFLDTHRITPELFAQSWFETLFAGVCQLKVVQAIWDFYFQQADTFLVFFLCLVILVNGREHILNLKEESKEKIVESIALMPAALEFDDVEDFCSLAVYYVLKTPHSFKRDLLKELFTKQSAPKILLSQALCLPVSASEVVENAADTESVGDEMERVRFFLVDCRPAEQYNAGHLPTAFHLDSDLMLQEPMAFSTVVQGLLSVQRQALAANSHAAGRHFCFLGSGRDEEDQYTHMVIASFLQKHIAYVSMLSGGYKAVHDYLSPDLSDMEEHTPSQCIVCCTSPSSSKSDSLVERPSSPVNKSRFFEKFSEVVKNKSSDFKEKLIDYIVNPAAEAGKKSDKLYRGLTPVFSIDDDDAPDTYHEGEEEEILQEVVSLSSYLKSPEALASFKCHQVKENGYMLESYIVVTKTHLIVLRTSNMKKNDALIVVKRLLSDIIRITSKKRHPDFITFKYGSPDGEIRDMDRFVIPKASEATEIIAQKIVNFAKMNDPT